MSTTTRNPCCMPLKKGVTIMAVIDVILSTIYLIVLIVAVVKYSRDSDKEDDDRDEEVAIWTSVFVIILAGLGLLLSLRLYNGAVHSNISYCRLWLIIKSVLYGLTCCSSLSTRPRENTRQVSWSLT
ncbi:uncharacterized protein LOC110849938 [Folsomia candida]|uniref:uncharacterized protein LOC110849938 n=1 Tax=Folsomia candida TaxID=158441 RepID=UPI000B906CE4|nr:uncharacterized protein LOC110849938 [Folsomia candida]